MSLGNQRPLGYDSQKAILRELNVDKRRGLSLVCPQIRSIVPLTFEEVTLKTCRYSFEFNNSFWYIEYKKDDVSVPKMRLCKNYKTVYEKTIGMEEDAFLDHLLKKYLRPGTFIRTLIIDRKKVEFAKLGPFVVEELCILGCTNYSILKDIISAIDKKCNLKKLEIEVEESSLDILDEPVVRNAEHLYLFFDGETKIANKFMDFRNKTLLLDFTLFSVEQVFEIGKSWISTKQEVGKKLVMPIREYNFICDAIDLFKPEFPESYMSIVISLGDEWFANSLSIPINEDTVLVVYGGEKMNKYMNWTFRMKIMKKEDVRPQIVH